MGCSHVAGPSGLTCTLPPTLWGGPAETHLGPGLGVQGAGLAASLAVLGLSGHAGPGPTAQPPMNCGAGDALGLQRQQKGVWALGAKKLGLCGGGC